MNHVQRTLECGQKCPQRTPGGAPAILASVGNPVLVVATSARASHAGTGTSCRRACPAASPAAPVPRPVASNAPAANFEDAAYISCRCTCGDSTPRVGATSELRAVGRAHWPGAHWPCCCSGATKPRAERDSTRGGRALAGPPCCAAGATKAGAKLDPTRAGSAATEAAADMPSVAATPVMCRASCRSRTAYATSKGGCDEEEAGWLRLSCARCSTSCSWNDTKTFPCCCTDVTCGGLTAHVMHTTQGRLQTTLG